MELVEVFVCEFLHIFIRRFHRIVRIIDDLLECSNRIPFFIIGRPIERVVDFKVLNFFVPLDI